MATIVPVALWGPSQLGTSAAAVVTTPAANTYVVTRAVFTNTGSTARTITVHIVRSGASATASNMVISAYTVQPGEAYVAPELSGVVLNGGDTIQALASAGSVITALGSGFSQ